jgi:hypothetical protein
MWPAGQVSWPADLTSGPHVPNLRLEHRRTSINTPMLRPGRSVKRVRFSLL